MNTLNVIELDETEMYEIAGGSWPTAAKWIKRLLTAGAVHDAASEFARGWSDAA